MVNPSPINQDTKNKIIIENLYISYSDGTESLKDVNLVIKENLITVLFGPAGGGKSTLLRVINRLNDLADVVHTSGRVLIDGEDILGLKFLEQFQQQHIF